MEPPVFHVNITDAIHSSGRSTRCRPDDTAVYSGRVRNDDTDRVIGATVHALMWRQRVTQRDIAGHLGIQQSAMSRKLRGTRPWLAAEVVAVAEVLGVPLAELFPR